MKKIVFILITVLISVFFLEALLQIVSFVNSRSQSSTYSKSKKRIIVTLGESTTSSNWSEHNWPSLLQKKLNLLYPNSYQIINLAVTGKSSSFLYDHLTTYLEANKIKPFAIITMIGINDQFLSSEYIQIPTSGKIEIKTFKLIYLLYKQINGTDSTTLLTKKNEEDIAQYFKMLPHKRDHPEEQLESLIQFVNQNLHTLVHDSQARKSVNLIDDRVLNGYYDQHRYLYELYKKNGYPQKIIPLLSRAIENNPKSIFFHHLLSGIYSDLGNTELAVKYATKAQILSMNRIHKNHYSTLKNIAAMTNKENIKLIVMQYPLLDILPLQLILKKYENVTYVSNKQNFLNVLTKEGYYHLFEDRFAGTFGHCTQNGNELISDNLLNTFFMRL
jgi:hypothetical protein